jgi:RHS repeat-associated protein
VRNDPSAPTNLMRFTGELFDTVTGLYHFRARQYDPTAGRFLQTDPIAPSSFDPYVASYVYVNNRPSLFVDPTGMFCVLGSNPDGSCRGGGIVRSIGSGMSVVGQVVTDTAGATIGTVADLTGGTSRQCGSARCVEGS